MEPTSATTLLVGGDLKPRNANVQTGKTVVGGNLVMTRGATFSGGVAYDSGARSLCRQDASSIQSTANTLWGLSNEYGCLDAVVNGGSVTFDTSAKDRSSDEPITVFCVRSSSLIKAHTITINNDNGEPHFLHACT